MASPGETGDGTGTGGTRGTSSVSHSADSFPVRGEAQRERDVGGAVPYEENSAFALPAAEEAKTLFPQPRRWRAAAKQARERQSRQGGRLRYLAVMIRR